MMPPKSEELVIRIGEGPTAADRHETRISDLREDHGWHSYCLHPPNGPGRARATRHTSRQSLRRNQGVGAQTNGNPAVMEARTRRVSRCRSTSTPTTRSPTCGRAGCRGVCDGVPWSASPGDFVFRSARSDTWLHCGRRWTGTCRRGRRSTAPRPADRDLRVPSQRPRATRGPPSPNNPGFPG